MTKSPVERAHELLASWQVTLVKNDDCRLPSHMSITSPIFGDGMIWDSRLPLVLAIVDEVGLHYDDYAADMFEALLVVHHGTVCFTAHHREMIAKKLLSYVVYPGIISGMLRTHYFYQGADSNFEHGLSMNIGLLLHDYFKSPEHKASGVADKALRQFSGLLDGYLNPKKVGSDVAIQRSWAILIEIRKVSVREFQEKPHKLYLELAHKIFAILNPTEQVDGLMRMLDCKLPVDKAMRSG